MFLVIDPVNDHEPVCRVLLQMVVDIFDNGGCLSFPNVQMEFIGNPLERVVTVLGTVGVYPVNLYAGMFLMPFVRVLDGNMCFARNRQLQCSELKRGLIDTHPVPESPQSATLTFLANNFSILSSTPLRLAKFSSLPMRAIRSGMRRDDRDVDFAEAQESEK